MRSSTWRLRHRLADEFTVSLLSDFCLSVCLLVAEVSHARPSVARFSAQANVTNDSNVKRQIFDALLVSRLRRVIGATSRKVAQSFAHDMV